MWKRSYMLLLMFGVLELSQAQRPSFAGLRPPGGLSQKDKYHATQNTAVENITGVDIATRFAEDSVVQKTEPVNLAYGASQKPPIGVPLVLPIGSYQPFVPLSTTSTTVENRFSGADEDATKQPALFAQGLQPGGTITSSGAGFRPNSSAANNVPVSNALPIDAHGDREYVNYLSQLPKDNQPFWFLNYQAIEALRNSTRPNVGTLETRGSFFAG